MSPMQSRRDSIPSDDPGGPDGDASAPRMDGGSASDVAAHSAGQNGWYADGFPAVLPYGTPDGRDAETAELSASGLSASGMLASPSSVPDRSEEAVAADVVRGGAFGRVASQIGRPVLLVNVALAALILAGGGFTYVSVANNGGNAARTGGGIL